MPPPLYGIQYYIITTFHQFHLANLVFDNKMFTCNIDKLLSILDRGLLPELVTPEPQLELLLVLVVVLLIDNFKYEVCCR